MNHNYPVVHCIYTENGKSISELLENSFRLYLIRILAVSGQVNVQCQR